jgi:hypothetical protein
VVYCDAHRVVLDYPQKASCLSKILIRVFALMWNLWRGPYGQVDENATIRPSGALWLANCYFTVDSLGFPALLPFPDAPSDRSVHSWYLGRLLGPGSVSSIVAESLLIKHQLLNVNRFRQRCMKSMARHTHSLYYSNRLYFID